jgi:uncharacterized protein YlxW (UPF0749 family)
MDNKISTKAMTTINKTSVLKIVIFSFALLTLIGMIVPAKQKTVTTIDTSQTELKDKQIANLEAQVAKASEAYNILTAKVDKCKTAVSLDNELFSTIVSAATTAAAAGGTHAAYVAFVNSMTAKVTQISPTRAPASDSCLL